MAAAPDIYMQGKAKTDNYFGWTFNFPCGASIGDKATQQLARAIHIFAIDAHGVKNPGFEAFGPCSRSISRNLPQPSISISGQRSTIPNFPFELSGSQATSDTFGILDVLLLSVTPFPTVKTQIELRKFISIFDIRSFMRLTQSPK